MPSFPISGPPPLDGGELPVRSVDDVLALLPPEIRNSAIAPVRDALATGLTAILQEYQRRSSRGASLSDILRATGKSIDGLAADHEVFRQPNESDASVIARVLGLQEMVTPNAIIDAVNAILAPFSDVKAKYFEANVDCWFVHDGTVTSFDAFVYTADNLPQASPRYPDRYYADDAAANGGDSIANREVLGAWVFADQLGRYFVVRLPQLEAVDELGSYAFDSTVTDDGMFIADGSDTDGAESDGSDTSFVYATQAVSSDLYAAIVSTVEFLKGQGMRWQAYVDPLLVAA